MLPADVHKNKATERQKQEAGSRVHKTAQDPTVRAAMLCIQILSLVSIKQDRTSVAN